MKCVMVMVLAGMAAGCGVTPDAYVPAEQGVWYGYGEAPAGAGRAEVGYLGREWETAERVHYFVMLRAAEVTVQAGKGAFRVVRDEKGMGYRERVRQEYFDEDADQEVAGGKNVTARPLETVVIEVAERGTAGTEDAVALVQQAEAEGELLEKRTVEAVAGGH